MGGGLVIVGASLAGIRTAEAAREAGYAGRIRLFGDEDELPYDRPPLSKKYLLGQIPDLSSLRLTTPERLVESSIEIVLGRCAVGVDTVCHEVSFDDDSRITYDTLVIATGARARSLPGTMPEGVCTLRTLSDSGEIAERLTQATNLVVIGAGFIGLEVAAAARTLDIPVRVIEALDAPLQSAVGRVVGEMITDLHRDHGTQIITSRSVEKFMGDPCLESVLLTDGFEITTDLAVVGIGTIVNSDWLVGIGIEPGRPVPCSSTGQVLGTEDTYAVGDVATWAEADGSHRRTEHWFNAVEQARLVGLQIAGQDVTTMPRPVPSFWSDQFQHKIQMVGSIQTEPDDVELSPGARADQRSYALLRQGDELAAAVTFNWPKAAGTFRRLVSNGSGWDQAVSSARELTVGAAL